MTQHQYIYSHYQLRQCRQLMMQQKHHQRRQYGYKIHHYYLTYMYSPTISPSFSIYAINQHQLHHYDSTTSYNFSQFK